MSVNDWFGEFLAGHLRCHPSVNLPAVDSPEGGTLYRAWRSEFVRRGVHDQDVATEASMRLVGEGLKHSSQHFPRLVELATEVYRERAAAGAPAGDGSEPREVAQAASRDCPHCHGEGLATVRRAKPRSPVCSKCGGALRPDGVCPTCHPKARPVPTTTAAYCVCAMGRWIEASHRRDCPDVWKGKPHLADALAKGFPWEPFAPENDPALDRVYGLFTPAELIAGWLERDRRRDAAARSDPPSPPPPPPTPAPVEPSAAERERAERRRAELAAQIAARKQEGATP